MPARDSILTKCSTDPVTGFKVHGRFACECGADSASERDQECDCPKRPDKCRGTPADICTDEWLVWVVNNCIPTSAVQVVTTLVEKFGITEHKDIHSLFEVCAGGIVQSSRYACCCCSGSHFAIACMIPVGRSRVLFVSIATLAYRVAAGTFVRSLSTEGLI